MILFPLVDSRIDDANGYEESDCYHHNIKERLLQRQNMAEKLRLEGEIVLNGADKHTLVDTANVGVNMCEQI